MLNAFVCLRPRFETRVTAQLKLHACLRASLMRPVSLNADTDRAPGYRVSVTPTHKHVFVVESYAVPTLACRIATDNIDEVDYIRQVASASSADVISRIV
ncbi:hypothetical protein LSAT2_014008 [Lamellibrachia satsuma]|nr:hypothetical protein LSAT2_014008 [Lamellibrachia satsuma]